MSKLAFLNLPQLDLWVTEARQYAQQGQLPRYIPRLVEVDRHSVAVQIQSLNGDDQAAGDGTVHFALMSVIKPFVLLYLLEKLGIERVFTTVGQQPSAQAYNSLAQLQADRGWPRNPMLNSGAIALCSLLPGTSPAERCANLQQWLNQWTSAGLVLDEQMLASVQSVKNERNQAIAQLLASSGYINQPDVTLQTYNAVCCLGGTVSDLAQLGLLLAGDGFGIQAEHRVMINSILLTCGLYEHSAIFAAQIGLPTKSGISGALLSVVPEAGAIAIYSPPLNATGNSVAGLWLLERIAKIFLTGKYHYSNPI